jgi:ABC-type Fe3+ transport system permease subunit
MTNGFKLFDQNLALTNGAPSNTSEMLALNIYNTFYGRVGFEGVGQAKAVVFFLIVAVIAIIQNRLTTSKEVQHEQRNETQARAQAVEKKGSMFLDFLFGLVSIAWILPDSAGRVINSFKAEGYILFADLQPYRHAKQLRRASRTTREGIEKHDFLSSFWLDGGHHRGRQSP